MNVNRPASPGTLDSRPTLVEPPFEQATQPPESGSASEPPASEPVPEPPERIGRIVGLDLARALAVLGMFYAHAAPYSEGSGLMAWLLSLPHGRSSALFATLAGVSLVLLAGGNRPKTGREGRQASVKIAIRAVVLVAVGALLTALGTSVAVILAYYGAYFLLALPFLRLRARTLVILAGVVAVGGPFLVGWVHSVDPSVTEAFEAHDFLATWSGEGILDFLAFGMYPAAAWMAYIFAGMALGKLDLAARANRLRLAIVGPALALVGYGGSWLLTKVFGIESAPGGSVGWDLTDEEWKAKALKEAGPGSMKELDPDKLGEGSIDVPGLDLASLVGASPHSGTPFELVGNIGVAVTVIVGAVVLLSRFAMARKLLAPITAVGAMSLTAYVGHIVVLWFTLDQPSSPETGSWALLGYLVAGTVAFAFAWSRFLKRGPLEYGLAAATRLARLVK